MENSLGLLGSAGGGLSSGGSTAGSMSTVSKEDLVMSSEVSSSYPDESELELGLGLSLGGGASRSKAAPWVQYARILTAEDFPSMVSKSSSSSSSSSSSVTKVNVASAGTKRTADDSVSPPRNSSGQVVGWPPIRAYRINSLSNQAKSPITEEFCSKVGENLRKNGLVDKTDNSIDKNNSKAKEKKLFKTSLFVKVNMDGVPIGRKLDLSAHSSYENLAQTLDDMFFGARSSGIVEKGVMLEAAKHSRLLDGSSEFVLTYEDKEGDWMLVGDVPWGMFLSSVKRLRILRKSEAIGLAPRSLEPNGRQRSKPV